MTPFIQFVDPDHNLQVFGVKLLGLNELTLHKLAFSLVFVALLFFLRAGLRKIAKAITHRRKQKTAFWTSQFISLTTFVIAVLGFVSIWFDHPDRLATPAGLLGAGLAFALQKVVTSFAAYFVILEARSWTLAIASMGGVRGDVISLNFLQTVVMEMGQPPATLDTGSGSWIHSRQYTGRIVSISNSTIFDEPVFNYTRDFPYIWEEMVLPISYRDDRRRAEAILIEAARRETIQIAELSEASLKILRERYFVEAPETQPRVYMRLTDNWVELTVRFLCHDHNIRGVKDRMSREVIDQLQAAGIGIASGTYEIVGVPPIHVHTDAPPKSLA